MKRKTNIEQISLFGVATDENSFMSTEWGKLTFYEAASNKWTDTCRHCLLWVYPENRTDRDECLTAPCSCDERADHRNGYYSIHNMPQQTNSNTK